MLILVLVFLVRRSLKDSPVYVNVPLMQSLLEELLERYIGVVVPSEAVANKKLALFDEAERAGHPIKREEDAN